MNLKRKILSLSTEKKAAMVFVFASAISSGLNIITTPLFTRLMPVDEFGVISLYNSWYQVLYVLASYSVTNAILNVGFHKYPEDRYGYLSSSIGIVTLFSVITAIILWILDGKFLEVSGLSKSLVVLMIFSFIFLTSTQLWINLQRYELKYKLVFLLLTGSAFASTVLALVLVITAKSNYAAIKLWSTNIVQIILGIFFFGFIILKGRKFYNKEYWKFILVYNAPLLIHYLSQFILNSSDRIMIGYYKGQEDVAIYSLGYSVANILLIFWYPLNSSIIPYIHKCIDNNEQKDLAECFYKVLIITGELCVIISLLSPEIIAILGGENYKMGTYVVPIVVASIFFTVFYSLTANIEFLYGKTYRIALMTIVAAAINIGLNAILIPIFGYIAAAYTTLIAYGVYSLLHYANMCKQYRKRFLETKKLLALMIIVIGACILSSVLFVCGVVRYIVIVIIAAMVCKKVIGKR